MFLRDLEMLKLLTGAVNAVRFCFHFGALCCASCGISVPQPGIEPGPWQ